MPKYSKLKESNAVCQSKPFYTQDHAHGYKLSLQVAPNGHGDYLMKGEFDEDLHWPLQRKMEIYLVDHKVFSELFADETIFRFVDKKSDVILPSHNIMISYYS